VLAGVMGVHARAKPFGDEANFDGEPDLFRSPDINATARLG
jgi:hypothetical protein